MDFMSGLNAHANNPNVTDVLLLTLALQFHRFILLNFCNSTEGIKQVSIYQENEELPMRFFVHEHFFALLMEHFFLVTERSIIFTMVKDPFNPETYVENPDNFKNGAVLC